MGRNIRTSAEGKLYTATNNQKACFKQMLVNPKIELSGMNKEGQWIRLTGLVSHDDRIEAKAFALEAVPFLKTMYSAEDGKFAVMRFESGSATISSVKGIIETFSF